jgi:hypothetical protein
VHKQLEAVAAILAVQNLLHVLVPWRGDQMVCSVAKGRHTDP